MKTLTAEYLKSIEACQEGIDFMVRNGLEGFPLARLDEIEGDYNDLYDWVKGQFDGETPKYQYERNAEGRVVKRMGADGAVWLFEYDAAGNNVKATMPDGTIYLAEFDERGNKITSKKPNGGSRAFDVTLFEYDAADNLVKQTSQHGNVWQYEYNDLGQKVKLIWPDGDEYIYEYDEIGNMVKRFMPKGYGVTGIWTYTHDEEGFTVSLNDGVLMTVPKF